MEVRWGRWMGEIDEVQEWERDGRENENENEIGPE